jgi:hypothetical protein
MTTLMTNFDDRQKDSDVQDIDVFNLPPRKEVHSKKKKKKEKKQGKTKTIVTKDDADLKIDGDIEEGDSRLHRREIKKEKKVQKWNVYIVRTILILFILILIAIPLYYHRLGFFQNEPRNQPDEDQSILEEIQFK